MLDWVASNLGVVISLFSTVLLGVGFIWALRVSVAVLDTRLTAQDRQITAIQDELKTLNRAMIDIAVQNQRMNAGDERMVAQGKRLDELSSRVNRYLDARGA